MDTSFFPNPVEQAAALIDECGGDLDEARALADLSVDCSSTKQELKWWRSVRISLTPSEVTS
jgi:hypothetical protein